MSPSDAAGTFAFELGRRDFRRGAPDPVDRWTDDQWGIALGSDLCRQRYLGYVVERALGVYREIKAQQRAEAVREWAERGGRLPCQD